jgi:hypothetical protein
MILLVDSRGWAGPVWRLVAVFRWPPHQKTALVLLISLLFFFLCVIFFGRFKAGRAVLVLCGVAVVVACGSLWRAAAGYLFGVPKKSFGVPKLTPRTCGSRGMFRSNESTATAGGAQVYCL